eukprot:7763645-Pyramimonas_sp.AAC.1
MAQNLVKSAIVYSVSYWHGAVGSNIADVREARLQRAGVAAQRVRGRLVLPRCNFRTWIAFALLPAHQGHLLALASIVRDRWFPILH